MDAATEDALLELLARQQIQDCILRYARGVDRLDRDLVLSVYHDDAIDYHGPVNGTREDFADWYWARQPQFEGVQHFIGNQTIEIDGDTAHAETYFIGLMRPVGKDSALFACGRYLDKLERRDGDWRVAMRVCVRESRFEVATEENPLPQHNLSRRDSLDPSYERPLQPRP
jgi:3-phenylpropionate/cinnamic acid dioxygenase small subunit